MWRRYLDIPGLIRTSVGRKQLRGGLNHRIWPVTSRMASIYRRTILRNTRIITVVGSYGKSTTTHCTIAALGDRGHGAGQGNSRGRVAFAILDLRPDRRDAVMEIGIDGIGQMAPLAKTVRPDITVVTTIGSEHNRSLGNLENTRNEKADMVRILGTSGLAILNGDDPNVRWMAAQTQAKIITYGFDDANQIRASDIQLDWPHGTSFLVHAHGLTRQFRVRLIGRHMIYPVLAATAVALAEGCTLDECAPRLEKIGPIPGRLEVMRLDNGAILLCDYCKSSYETILAALDVFSEIPAKRRIAVLGDVSEPPGSQGPIYRGIGERIAGIASRAVFLGNSFQRYKAGTKRGGLAGHAVVNAKHNVLDAADALRGDLGPGDVVLIKGRDTQRLDRVALSLAGRNVQCTIPSCKLKISGCSKCPMLETGWGDLRVVT